MGRDELKSLPMLFIIYFNIAAILPQNGRKNQVFSIFLYIFIDLLIRHKPSNLRFAMEKIYEHRKGYVKFRRCVLLCPTPGLYVGFNQNTKLIPNLLVFDYVLYGSPIVHIYPYLG